MNTQYHAAKRAVSAVLRAAVAYNRRNDEPRAWAELSRMHGVLLGHLEIGTGPATPADMIRNLHKPLRHWIPLDWDQMPDGLGDLAVLDYEGQLTDAAFDVGCSYTEVLFDPSTGGLDGGRDWLPSWSWQTAEQTEHALYNALSAGTQAEYEAGRLMLVEVTSGTKDEILAEYDRRKAPRVGAYGPIPAERVWTGHGVAWWWPCPECRYPMRVAGAAALRCDFPPHRRAGRFLLDKVTEPGHAPTVHNAKVAVQALPADGILCLDWPTWRYMTVPGLTEVGLLRWLESKGATVVMWEQMDSWDLGVTLPDGWSCRVDVKDQADPRDIIASPPRADHIVVPSYRADQVADLCKGLDMDRYTVNTVAGFQAMITRRLKGGAR